MTDAVVDASAIVDLLIGNQRGIEVSSALREFAALHAPSHMDAEVLSALGRLHRAGTVSTRNVSTRLDMLAGAPIERHPLPALLLAAWRRRERFGLMDALYVELAERLGAELVTTDARLASAAGVRPVGA